MTHNGKECGMCGKVFFEMGQSSWCDSCGKLMCPACEDKHNKAECKDRREGRL